MKTKILVTGCDGQLGRSLQDAVNNYPNFEFVFTDIKELDICSQSAVREYLLSQQPQWVINAAAYTNVDKAESETQKALELNATAVGYLAEESKNIEAGFVHISTDYVFRGDEPKALTEEDLPSPISVYGITKLQGEIEAQKNPRHIILRTSWLYSKYGKNFVKTMMQLSTEKSDVSVVADQWGSPTLADDLVIAIMTAIQNPTYGIYHFSNEGVATWAMFAEKIMELIGSDCVVKSITSKEFNSEAERPEYSILNKEKFSKTFGVTIPDWEISLENFIEKLNN